MNRKKAAVLAVLLLAFSVPVAAVLSQNQAGPNAENVDTTYRVASSGGGLGSLMTGQSADIMLSGIDFNDTGGGLLFNHPGGIATDGQHLLLADTDNNRILIWNSPPGPGSPPDLVLGQKSFHSNTAGHGLGGLDWPVAMSTGGGKLVVADTYNNRILIWKTFPTRNDQPADLEIEDQGFSSSTIYQTFTPLRSIVWPWGVWTNGDKLAVSSTGGPYVLIWNTFPTANNQSADIYLTASGKFGTPRGITSDGTHLMVADHNAKVSSPDTSFVWDTLPSQNDQPFDYFMSAIPGTSQSTGYVDGTILADGRTILVGEQLYIFDSFPTNNSTKPEVILGSFSPHSATQAYLSAGAGRPCVIGSKLYLSLENPNKIVVYNSIPASSSAEPAYAIGSPDPYTNSLDTHFFMTNPNPVTDGKHLFVSSDFDNKLYVYRNLPDQSGAHPDFVYDFYNYGAFQPGAIALYRSTLVVAGGQDVYIWKTLPLKGQPPDLHFSGGIGNVKFQDLAGVAVDSQHLYLSDRSADKIYVWNGIPSNDSNPAIVLSTDQPARLSTDGKYLVVTATFSMVGSPVRIYTISNLTSASKPVNVDAGLFNLPEEAITAGGKLFVADTVGNRVMIWNNLTKAMENASADVVLGCQYTRTVCYNDPEIGKNTIFWPATLTFDGRYLWVGEFKFSGRILRFSVGGPEPPAIPRMEAYDIQAGSNAFAASLDTNATTSVMDFSDQGKVLTINVTSTAPVYVNATFATAMLNGSLKVEVDGSLAPAMVSYNKTYTAVYVVPPSGTHVVTVAGSNAVAETTSTTTTATTTSRASSSTCPGASGSATTLAIQPCVGPSGTLATISGDRLAPNHVYQYCLQSGPPPPPGSASLPCQAGSPTFTTNADGSIPTSPAVTIRVVGTPGQYSVVIRDSADSAYIVWLGFDVSSATATITAGSFTSMSNGTASTTSGNTATESSVTSSTGPGISTTSNSSTANGGGIPEFPFQLLAVFAFTAVIVASYKLTSRRRVRRASSGGRERD